MIPYSSVLTHIKDIQERNNLFNSLDKKIQRKEIALDGLNLVLTRVVQASENGYWSFQLRCIDHGDPVKFQDILLHDLPTDCAVCQRGLFMLSQIRLGNELSSDEEYIERGTSKIIKGFTLNSFEKMEALYEKFEHCAVKNKTLIPYKPNTWEMMANICCNVIANGNFKVNDTTDYLKLWELTRSETFAS